MQAEAYLTRLSCGSDNLKFYDSIDLATIPSPNRLTRRSSGVFGLGRVDRQRFVQTAFPGPNLRSSDRASTNVREGHWFHPHWVASATELLLTVTRLALLLPSRAQALPYRGFHPSCLSHSDPFRSGTRDLFCPGACPLRAAPADSSPAAPSLPFTNRHSPGFPSCHDARLDFEVFFHTEMLGSFAVLPARELAPLFRF